MRVLRTPLFAVLTAAVLVAASPPTVASAKTNSVPQDAIASANITTVFVATPAPSIVVENFATPQHRQHAAHRRRPVESFRRIDFDDEQGQSAVQVRTELEYLVMDNRRPYQHRHHDHATDDTNDLHARHVRHVELHGEPRHDEFDRRRGGPGARRSSTTDMFLIPPTATDVDRAR